MGEYSASGLSADDAMALIAAAILPLQQAANLLRNSPYTVQDGGANPLSSVSTVGVNPGSLVGISDLGGCGPNGVPGFGFAIWTGTEFRRVSRGVQTVRAPAAIINLDYWKDPMRIVLSGTTLVTTRILLANGKEGALYSLAKPGISSLLSAFGTNLLGGTGATDIAVVGPNTNYFEIIASTLTQVQTT